MSFWQNIFKGKGNNVDHYHFDPLTGKTQREISYIKKEQPRIKKKYGEILDALATTRDKSIKDCLNKELEKLQKECFHLDAQRTHLTGMVMQPCPDCGFVDPSSNYANNNKKTPE